MQKLEWNHPETQSQDIIQDNLELLKTIFPEAFTEGKIEFVVLKQLLGDELDQQEEKYGLNWHGKRAARRLALTPSTGTLRPCLQDSLDWDTTQNLMIEGDNLEVLKLLQKSYAGKVKLIYIDPPYNTGNDFIYKDDFSNNIKNYQKLTGLRTENGLIETSLISQKNPQDSGRFHTSWLNMMYPRLKLARSLLQDDGVVLVSIDDNEYENLIHLMNEIYGVENYIGTFVVNSTPNARDYGHIAKMHEYAIFFSKNVEFTETYQLETKEKKFKYHDDISGFNVHPLYNSNEAFTPQNRPNLYYSFFLYPDEKVNNCQLSDNSRTNIDNFYKIGFDRKPGCIEIFPPKSEKNGVQFVWRWGKAKSFENLNVEIIGYKTEQNEYRIVQKLRHTTKLIRSIIDSPEVTTRRGTAEVEEIFGTKIVNFPKPTGLIQNFIQVATKNSVLIIDFFAGSGTTGHSVALQNLHDGGNRRYILVQLPEPLDILNNEQKKAAEYCDKLGKPRNIAELTKERLRRVSKKIKDENPLFHGDLGFRVFKLDSSNIRAWEANRDNLPKTLEESIEHLKPDRTESDILYELLLKLGLDLCVPIENKSIAGKTVYSIGNGVLLVCMAEQISQSDAEPLTQGIIAWHKQLAPAGDTTCVFRDSAFSDDVTKTNLSAILNQHDLTNIRSL